MKKTLLTVALTIASLASFGQGYFYFNGSPRFTWDAFTSPGAIRGNTTVDVAFLWGATTATPLIDGIATSTATNGAAINVTGAWSDIMNDANFHLAVDSSTSLVAVQQTTAAGGWSYNNPNDFGVSGTVAQSYLVYVIGWNAAYATPTAAAAAGSAVGWSAPFTYAAATSIGTPLSMTASGLTAFGVLPPIVPEPTTMALAGLGGLALLAFRRRK